MRGLFEQAIGVEPRTSAHVRNWMDCIRSSQQQNAPIEAGCEHRVALSITIAALPAGKRVTFDDARQALVAV